MRVPSVKPTKFTFETSEILKNFSKELNTETAKEHFPRLHKENIFNKRFSGILDAFCDVQTVTERLTENIEKSLKVEREIQQKDEIDQELHREADRLTRQNKTDLKALYVYCKIFLDEYTAFMSWLLQWRGIKNSSVTEFYKSVSNYDGDQEDIIIFKERCLKKLKAIDVYITGYRDKQVVHNGDKHKQSTKWFLNEMNGNIRFMGGGRPSITPQEVLFILVEYIDCSNKFCFDWLNGDLSSETQP